MTARRGRRPTGSKVSTPAKRRCNLARRSTGPAVRRFRNNATNPWRRRVDAGRWGLVLQGAVMLKFAIAFAGLLLAASVTGAQETSSGEGNEINIGDV